MKKSIRLISLALFSLGFKFVYSMDLTPSAIGAGQIPGVLSQLQNLINSIPVTQRRDLSNRFASLPAGGMARVNQFRALLTDAQNAYRAMPPPPVAEAIVPPAAVAEEIVPPVAEPIVVHPHLQVEQVDPQVHVQPVVQQPEPAVAKLILQQPAPLIEEYFKSQDLFGPGKLIVDVKSFNLRYVNDLYRHLECEHLDPMIATKFLQFCFGKYIDLRAVQLYISELSIGEICNMRGNRDALTLAFLDGLVQFLEDDSIILPKIKKSDLVDHDGIPLYDTYIQQNGGNLRHIDEAILAYNSFVDSLNQHVIASITSAEIEGTYGFTTDQASIRWYCDLVLINEDDSFDEILLERIGDPSLEMNVVCYNHNGKVADWYIEKNTYDTLSDDDKKIAKKIAYACYLRRYALLTGPLDNDMSNSFRDSYLRTAELSIEEDSLYHKVVDLATLARLRINSDPALYSVEPLRAVIRAINLDIATMSEDVFKEYFQKLIFRMIHLSMSPKVGNTLTSKKPRIFGSHISTQDLQQYEIETWLREYHLNKTAHTGSFGATAFADTDYHEGDPNEHTLLQHLRDALTNIYGDGFGNAGMYYSSEIIRFIAAKLEKSILFLETHPELTPKATNTLDDLSITLGMFLQGLHHCANGRVELISKTFPRLMEASDIGTLNIAQISHIILKLAASDLIADTLQFHTMDGQQTRLVAENATFFAATLRLLGGKFGAIVGAGTMLEWNHGTESLKNYLEHARPAIWDALPRETKLLLITANQRLTEEIVTDIMETAISPSRLIEYLIDEKNVGTIDLLIQKYLDSQRIMGYSFNSTARRKQIIADILRSIDAI